MAWVHVNRPWAPITPVVLAWTFGRYSPLHTRNTPQDLPSWRCYDPVFQTSQFSLSSLHLPTFPPSNTLTLRTDRSLEWDRAAIPNTATAKSTSSAETHVSIEEAVALAQARGPFNQLGVEAFNLILIAYPVDRPFILKAG